MTYYFGEHQRWSLIFAGPNYAGCALACAVPWVWRAGQMVQGKAWRLGMILLVEALLCFALCKTYSRGALVAVAAAGLYFFLLGRTPRQGSVPAWNLRTGLVRLALWLAIIAWTGFDARIDPAYSSADQSVLNRISLWEGGVRMIAAAPLQGWGIGTSGQSYVQWFQQDSGPVSYLGMVNLYLQVAIEAGLVVFCVLVILISWLLIVPFARRHRRLMSLADLGSGASIAAWATANAFSTLVGDPVLWAIIGGCAAWLIFRQIQPWRVLCASATLAAATAAAIYFLGSFRQSRSEFQVRREGQVVLLLNQRAGASATLASADIFPDMALLGEQYGRSIRRLIRMGLVKTAAVHLAPGAPRYFPFAFYFGSSWRYASAESQAVYVAPTDFAETVSPCRLLIVPAVDQWRERELWRYRAAIWKTPVVIPKVNSDLITELAVAVAAHRERLL